MSDQDTKKEEAIMKANDFYRDLEILVKRYLPINFAPYVASILHSIVDKPNKWGLYAPHHLVNSIEANCAYFRGHRETILDNIKFNEIIGHYIDYYDPYLKFVINELKDIDLFSLAMSRAQFDLQHTPTLDAFARSILLYGKSNILSSSQEVFKNKTKIEINDWIYLCFIITSHIIRTKNPVLHMNNLIDSEIESMPRTAVPIFLEHASSTPSEIGTYFHEMRSIYPPHLHIFIKSAFFSTPLLDLDENRYLVVHPNLIFNFADQGIYEICSQESPDVFANEFGKSFEQYVGNILEEFYPRDNIKPEKIIMSSYVGKVCDYLVEFQDCILLLECKATKYSADLLTENAVRNDNSTGKIANGFEQIVETGKMIKTGLIDEFIADKTKPIYAIVVLYGELYFANSQSYFDNFISSRMRGECLEPWPYPLEHQPQIMKIDTLERFLVVLREKALSPKHLIDQKLDMPYIEVGDWQAYIKTFSDDIDNWEIPLISRTASEFVNDVMGI